MEMSATINELAAALAKAQGEMKNAAKSSDNPYFKSKYADLAEVLNVAREPLSKNGLSFMQANEGVQNGYMSVTTLLMHSSGQYVKSTGLFPIGKQDAQGNGSALTYARRYSLAAMLGIAQEDDDGNAACGAQNQPQQRQNRQQVQRQGQAQNNAPKANQQSTGDKFVRIDPQGNVYVAVNAGKDANGQQLVKYKNIIDVKMDTLEDLLKNEHYKLAHEAIKKLLASVAEKPTEAKNTDNGQVFKTPEGSAA